MANNTVDNVLEIISQMIKFASSPSSALLPPPSQAPAAPPSPASSMDLTPLDGKGRWLALISQPLGPPRSPRRSEAPRDRLSLHCLKHCSVSLEEGTSIGNFGPGPRAHFDHLPGLELSPSEESAGSRLPTFPGPLLPGSAFLPTS